MSNIVRIIDRMIDMADTPDSYNISDLLVWDGEKWVTFNISNLVLNTNQETDSILVTNNNGDIGTQKITDFVNSLGLGNFITSVNGKTGPTITLTNSDVGAAATVHNHTLSQITDYPASAALKANLSGADFTGNLTIRHTGTGNNAPGIWFGSSSTPNVGFEARYVSAGQSRLQVINLTGGNLDFDINPQDGSGFANVRFFRNSTTTGFAAIQVCRANGAQDVNCQIGASGNSYFSALVGNVAVGHALPTAKFHVVGNSIFTDKMTLGGRLQFGNTATIPSLSGAVTGESIYVTGGNSGLYVYNGTSWDRLGTASDLGLKANSGSPTFTGTITQSFSTGNYAAIFHIDASQYTINKHTASGVAARILIDPRPADTTNSATVRICRNTNTNGDVSMDLFVGNGTPDMNCRIGGNISSYLNALHGNVGIGTDNPVVKFDINSNSIRIRNQRSPASNATGIEGEWAWDTNYIYVCTATNTWKRAALSSY